MVFWQFFDSKDSVRDDGIEKETSPTKISRTYQEIIGLEPMPIAGIASDYPFPFSPQYRNGCFAFAANHIVMYKYGLDIDLLEAEEKIDKSRDVLWEKKYIEKFLNEYDLEMEIYNDADNFFKFLAQGEPVMIQYKYPLEDDKWVGHLVAAYSFDDQGVWVSDSLENKNLLLDYDQVFDNTGRKTQFSYFTIDSTLNDKKIKEAAQTMTKAKFYKWSYGDVEALDGQTRAFSFFDKSIWHEVSDINSVEDIEKLRKLLIDDKTYDFDDEKCACEAMQGYIITIDSGLDIYLFKYGDEENHWDEISIFEAGTEVNSLKRTDGPGSNMGEWEDFIGLITK